MESLANTGSVFMDGLSVTLDLSDVLIQNPTFLFDTFDGIEKEGLNNIVLENNQFKIQVNSNTEIDAYIIFSDKSLELAFTFFRADFYPIESDEGKFFDECTGKLNFLKYVDTLKEKLEIHFKSTAITRMNMDEELEENTENLLFYIWSYKNYEISLSGYVFEDDILWANYSIVKHN